MKSYDSSSVTSCPGGSGLGVAGQRRPQVRELVVGGVVLVEHLGLPGEEHVARSVEDDAPAVDDDDAGHDLDERVHLVGDDQHVTPWAASRPSTSARTCWLAVSTPAVGSSIRSTSGWAARARAMRTRRC